MPLVDIEIPLNGSDVPDDVVEFLREADSRVGQFVRDHSIRVTAFVPSNYATVYQGLRAIAEANLAPGTTFCEWGSGFGVVASLAAMLDFDVCGIEIESDLVDASRRLSVYFGLPVDFVQGSFIPEGAEEYADEACAESNSEYFWLVTDSDDAYDELGLEPNDFDVVFAYPWPGEECLITGLFEKYAAEGALLLMYNQYDSLSLRRKVGRRSGRR